MSTDFVEGEVYFRLTYPGPSLNYPLIETFVFVGKNLSDEDKEDTWYFQFADSYAESGSVVGSSGGDRRVVCASAKDVSDMVDEGELHDKLIAARNRRAKRGSRMR